MLEFGIISIILFIAISFPPKIRHSRCKIVSEVLEYIGVALWKTIWLFILYIPIKLERMLIPERIRRSIKLKEISYE